MKKNIKLIILLIILILLIGSIVFYEKRNNENENYVSEDNVISKDDLNKYISDDSTENENIDNEE